MFVRENCAFLVSLAYLPGFFSQPPDHCEPVFVDSPSQTLENIPPSLSSILWCCEVQAFQWGSGPVTSQDIFSL